MKDVVIFAGSAVGSTLSIAHQVSRQYSIKTYAICLNSNYSAVYKRSRFITESIEMYAETDSCLFAKFRNWTNQHAFSEPPILYATTDSSCVFINNHREWFLNNFELTTPSSRIILTYNYKGVAEFDAQLNGLCIPKTRQINGKIDILEVIEKYNFPVIIKPTSYTAKSVLGFKTKLFDRKEEFAEYFESIDIRKGSVICQEYISGKDKEVYYYLFYRDDKGNIYENIGIKKLQSPPGAGIMAIGITKYNNIISRISREFLEKISYVGIGGIEYKKYRGEYYFIEMSTRAEGFLKICEASNVHIAKIAYQRLSGISINPEFKQIDRIEYIDIIPTLLARRIEGRYLLFLKEVIIAILSRNSCFNVLALVDIKPFIALLRKMIKSI